MKTRRAYRRTETGTLEYATVSVGQNNQVYGISGYPLSSDGKVIHLSGWPDDVAFSYENGKLLVPFK